MRSERQAVSVAGVVLAITAAWWLLALWPAEPAMPDWLRRTRYVCFGVTESGLPDAAGWMVLLLQPAGMLGLVAVIWGRALGRGVQELWAGLPGRLAVGSAALMLAGGVALAGLRVARAERAAGLGDVGDAPVPFTYARVDRAAPPLTLIDQHGDTVSLDALRGEHVVVTFALAHCQTLCPVVVGDAQAARRDVGGRPPRLLVVTLDPWRDVPSRLRAIAAAWSLSAGEHVLSGSVAQVEAVLDAWGVPRRRHPQTGDVIHPRLFYLVGPDGRIVYAASGGRAAISELLRRMRSGIS